MHGPSTTAPALFVRHYQQNPGDWQEVMTGVLKSRIPVAKGISNFHYQDRDQRKNLNLVEEWIYEGDYPNCINRPNNNYIDYPYTHLNLSGIKHVWAKWSGRAVTDLLTHFEAADRPAMTVFFTQFLQSQTIRSLADFVYSGDTKILDEAVRTKMLQLFRKRIKTESRLWEPQLTATVAALNARIQTLDQTMEVLHGSMPRWVQVEQKMGPLPYEKEKHHWKLRFLYNKRLKMEASVPPYALPAPRRVYFHKESLVKELETLSSLPNFITIKREVEALKKTIQSFDGCATLNHKDALNLPWVEAIRTATKNPRGLDRFEGFHFNKFFDEFDELKDTHLLRKVTHKASFGVWDDEIQAIRGKEAKPLPTFYELVKNIYIRPSTPFWN